MGRPSPDLRSRLTFGKSPVRESRTPGPVRGDRGNPVPYRDISYIGPSPRGNHIRGACRSLSEVKTGASIKTSTRDLIFGLLPNGGFHDASDFEAYAAGMAAVLLDGAEKNRFYLHLRSSTLLCIDFSYAGRTTVGNITADKYKFIAYPNECYGLAYFAEFETYAQRPDGPALIKIERDPDDAQLASPGHYDLLSEDNDLAQSLGISSPDQLKGNPTP